MTGTKQDGLVDDPLLEQPPRLHPNPAATWGPATANALLTQGDWYDQPRRP